jgi:dTDP-4-amino-4,6-dideoxygalactose transaminase
MTEMQSAIGRIQLEKLDTWVKKRRENARVLLERLSEYEALRIPLPGEDYFHSYYKLYAFICSDYLKSNWDRDRVIREIDSLGVPCRHGSCGEIYKEKAFRDAGLAPTIDLPIANELHETSLEFPVHPTLCEDDMHRIADAVGKVLSEAAI